MPSAADVVGHRLLGASTGFMTDHYRDWPALVSRAAEFSTTAVELSALSESELPSLEAFLAGGQALPFLYVSIHAPSKDRDMPEAELIETLGRLAGHANAIVIHPDVIEDPARYRVLGPTLVLENMDARKRVGQTASDLTRYYAELPEAGLCFDVAHVASVDPSLSLGHELLDAHGHRLRHVHLSSLDRDCHHRSLTAEDERRFAPLLDRCRDVPWILEAPAR
jgi:sugar phosphate isomerase/epimerase